MSNNVLDHIRSIHLTTPNGSTALHIAATNGNTEALEHLLHQASTEPSAVDHRGWTPLHCAADYGHADCVAALLTLSTNELAAGDKRGRTPLHLAASNGHTAVVEALLASGADVNLRCNVLRWVPLHYAASEGHTNCIELLLSDVAEFASPSAFINVAGGKDKSYVSDIDAVDTNNNTALHLALRNARIASAELLIRRLANVKVRNMIGWTPLHYAARLATVNSSIIERLLLAGAEIDAVSTNVTPLHVAAGEGCVAALNILIAHGAALGATDAMSTASDTVLTRKASHCSGPQHTVAANGHIDALRTLICHGADVNSCDENGQTPLHLASEQGQLGGVKELLLEGADVNLQNQDGRTARALAIQSNMLLVGINSQPYDTLITLLANAEKATRVASR